MKSIFFFVVLLSNFVLLAQDKPFRINSGEVIQKGISLHDNKEYEKAIAEYIKIPENDTNYVDAMYEASLSAQLNKDFKKAHTFLDKALQANKGGVFLYRLETSKAALYDEEGQLDSANVKFKALVNKYPNHYMVYHSLGVNYCLKKEYDSAFYYLKKAVIMNPYSYNSHYFLGVMALDLGYPVQALQSFAMCIALNNGGQRYGPSIQLMDDISKMQDRISEAMENKKKHKFLNEDFNELESLVASKIALEKSYKSKSEFTDALVKQLHLIFEKAPVSKDDQKFWSTFYGPLYQKIFKEDLFNGFVCNMLSGLNSNEIQKIVKSNSKNIDKALNISIQYLDEIGYVQSLTKTKDASVPGVLFSKGAPAAKGLVQGEYINGKLFFYNDLGNVKEIVTFVDNKKEGETKAFYNNGIVHYEVNYKNNKADGPYKKFNKEGVLTEEVTYKEGLYDGALRQYASNGLLEYEKTYKAGVLNGLYKEYFFCGGLYAEGFYTEDKLQGSLKKYYANGVLQAENNYDKNEMIGLQKYYYPNGSLESEFTITNGENAKVTYYFPNGNIKSKISIVNQQKEGECLFYHSNNTLKESSFFKKDKLHGLSKTFNHEGKLTSEIEYRNNKIIQITQYNALTGAIQNNLKLDDKYKNNLKIYDDYGNLISEVVCDREGSYNGLYKSYYIGNKPKYEVEYVKGDKEGKATEYHKNGKILSVANYTKGELNGYFQSYSYDGTLYAEGHYLNNERDGYWYQYNAFGKLYKKNYYIKGYEVGNQYEYTFSGKVAKIKYYEHDKAINETYFDSIGNKIAFINFKNLNEQNTITYNHYGKSFVKTVLKNACPQKKRTAFYADGQIKWEENIINGKVYGLSKEFYPTGALQHKYPEFGGVVYGLKQSYSLNGGKTISQQIWNDDNDGLDTFFHTNGKTSTIINNNSDNLDGWLTEQAPNGDLAYKILYHNDYCIAYQHQKPDGSLTEVIPFNYNSPKPIEVKTYYKNGQLSHHFFILNGEYVGKRIVFFPNGKMYLERLYDNFGRFIESKEYFENGVLLSEEYYIENRLNGKSITRNNEGKIIRELNFVKGMLHGPQKYYDNTEKLIKTLTYVFDQQVN